MTALPASLLLATRNEGKIRELTVLFGRHTTIRLVTLAELALPETSAEEGIEAYNTFAENARAKALYFARLPGMATLADDSGLCVRALGGAPGVRSRRFAPGAPLRGAAQDNANNQHLLSLLAGVQDRAACYVCSVVLAWPSGESVGFTRICRGSIAPEPRGSSGFGYDPLFYVPTAGQTFAELAPERKELLSHRGRAVRAALRYIARQG